MRRSLSLSTFDPLIPRTIRARAARLRDPLVQVWLLVALAFMFGIVSHYRSDARSGDEKIASIQSPARLLLGGARMSWSDDFAGPSAGESRARPIQTSALPEWKADAAAAGRMPWRHLDQAARHVVNSVPRGALREVPFLTVWSGGRTGNQELVALHRSRREAAEVDFVIGNGTRSGDGEIEVSSAWLSRTAEKTDQPVRICFVGVPGEPTTAQRRAAGELLNYLEARFGRLRGEPIGENLAPL